MVRAPDRRVRGRDEIGHGTPVLVHLWSSQLLVVHADRHRNAAQATARERAPVYGLCVGMLACASTSCTDTDVDDPVDPRWLDGITAMGVASLAAAPRVAGSSG